MKKIFSSILIGLLLTANVAFGSTSTTSPVAACAEVVMPQYYQPGTIDSGYRGEIGVLLHNLSDSMRFIEHGDRIAQLVICPVAAPLIYECNVLDETERGEGGFGSTGQ